MYPLILFLILIISLFFLSIRIQRALGSLLFRLTGNYKTAVYIVALIILPGTFVHEMAHFLMAIFLLVPARDMTLMPEISGDSIRLGSVKVGKTDIFRSFLISSAPVIFGVSMILMFSYLIRENLLPDNLSWLYYIFSYFIFAISNSMFMSKKDLKGVWGFLLFFALVIITGLLFGLNFNILGVAVTSISGVIETANLLLGIPLLMDIALLIILKLTAGLKWH